MLRSILLLGISGEKVEIDPVSSKRQSVLTLRQKAVTYDIDRIASCDILEDRGGGTLYYFSF